MSPTPTLPRILVAGVGPIPPERPGRLYAPGLRIWGMARELARAGHAVRLCCVGFERGDGERNGGRTLQCWDLLSGGDSEATPDLGPVQKRPVDGDVLAEALADEARDFDAGAVVGSTDVVNHALACAGLTIPIWMDFFGDPMAERQMQAARAGSDDALAAAWAMLVPALLRADRVSGCAHTQCGALLGQLGALGRLGGATAFEPMVQRLRPWTQSIEPDGEGESLVRGPRAPEDAFIVVQTGGFNTWLDVETLWATLEAAMAADPRVHFAATGGAIPGHYEQGFEGFAARVAESRFRNRIHLLGWLPLGRVPRLIAEGDLGLNVDADCPEGRLGTRNRIMDWLLGGLPVISTPGCELAEELARVGGLTLAPHGDADALAEAIARVAADRDAARETARAGRQHLARHHTPETALAPLLKWAAAPERASDLLMWETGRCEPSTLAAQARSAIDATDRADWARRVENEAVHELAELKGSRWVRWAMRLRRRPRDGEPPPQGP